MSVTTIATLASLTFSVVGMMLVIGGVLIAGLFLPGVVLIGIGLLGWAVAGITQSRSVAEAQSGATAGSSRDARS